MTDGKLRLVLVAAAMALIIVALVVVGGFNVNLFKRSYEDSISRSYQVTVFPAKRNIEYALRYGKPLSHFYGMEKLLKKIANNIPEIEDIYVVDPEGYILYDTNGEVEGKRLPAELSAKISSIAAGVDTNLATCFYQDNYYYFSTIKDKDDKLAGYINFSLPKSVINKYVEENLWTIFQAIVVVVIISLNFLVFILFAMPIFAADGKVRKKLLITIVTAVFLLANICYTIFSASLFRSSYEALTAKNMAVLLQSIGDDINSVIDKGIDYHELAEIEDYLEKLMAGLPEVGDIAIMDQHEGVLYHSAAKNGGQAGDEVINQPLHKDYNAVSGTLRLSLTPIYVQEKIKNIMLRSALIFVIFLFIIPAVMYKAVDFIPLIKSKLATKIKSRQFTSEVK